eukprot:CAMPEP_0173103610 /NCGR_PEP_ID=MMETSP1102-20130122/38506_1 /TAXON_ID=49646 /ORGANISM="Geminigera sp., Strain Caron Lab Isolate" /LENGTH=488 /DNA_ID=CAMNT_0013998485 /DNA_START=191 /DNA_END=1660 /DNA_ORIENTATION=-
MPFGKKAQEPRALPKEGVLRLFSLDLHQAVIADVKDVFERLFGDRIEVHDWNVTGYGDPAQFGFKSPWRVHDGDTHQHLINSDSWYGIDAEMISRFVWKYSHELKDYDGFIVSHSPVFCRLFEAFEKPIILVNTCRYDQPYCWNGNMQERDELHQCLQRLALKQMLIPISNNKADQAYLKLGTGIESCHIPSLCLYTNVTHEYLSTNLAAPCLGSKHLSETTGKKGELAKDLASVTALTHRPSETPVAMSEHNGEKRVTRGHTWKELYQRQALVHVPYEMSTMSLFEQYSAGVPLVFPTKRFYTNSSKKAKSFLGISGRVNDCGVSDRQTQNVMQCQSKSLSVFYWASFEKAKSFLGISGGSMGAALEAALVQSARGGTGFLDAVSAQRRSDDTVFLEMGDPTRQIPDELVPTLDLDFWIDKADFYDLDHMPGLFYYDSWDQLQEILSNGSLSETPPARSLASRQLRVEKILDMWRPLILSKFPLLKT